MTPTFIHCMRFSDDRDEDIFIKSTSVGLLRYLWREYDARINNNNHHTNKYIYIAYTTVRHWAES